MCLGVPGRIVRIDDNALGVATGRVDFGGVSRDVCLAYVPEAAVGDYVIVHVGFAISRVDEEEAQRTYEILREMNQLDELAAIREAIEFGDVAGEGVASLGDDVEPRRTRSTQRDASEHSGTSSASSVLSVVPSKRKPA